MHIENGSEEHEAKVRARAYEICELKGYPEGEDRDHWKQAEQELTEAHYLSDSESLVKTHLVRPSPTKLDTE